MLQRAVLVLPLVFALFPACSSKAPDSTAPRACTLDVPSAAPDWRLHADGTVLRDSLNRIVLLHGINTGGRSKVAPYLPFDFDVNDPNDFTAKLNVYMDHATTWGINVLRVPFIWQAMEPTQGKDDEEYLKKYDALLDAAWARGMWTIVDFHQDLYAEPFCGDGFPNWTVPDPKPAPHHDCPAQWGFGYFNDKGVMASFDAFFAKGSPVQAEFLSMWDRMLARHKDRPGVIGFEIINEPSHGSSPDSVAWEASTLSDFYASVVPRIRAGAPNSLLFLDPEVNTVLSQESSVKVPAGSGLVFAPHFYPIGGTSGMASAMKKWADFSAQWNIPMFIGEFARANTVIDAAQYVRAEWDAIDVNGISGGAQWEYSQSPLIWNNELFSITAPDGKDFPVADSIRRVYPRVVAGGPVAMTVDIDDSSTPAKRTATWSYAPAPGVTGVTDFALPDNAYPDGFDLALTGGCVDRSKPNRLLVKADDGAAQVTMTITSHQP